jgi:hypothetical protein
MKIIAIKSWTLFAAGILLALSVWTCSLPHEPGPQPSEIVDTEFNPALNVLGILRLDGEPNSSYVYIERAYRYQELDDLGPDEAFILIISDATVHVQGLGDTTSYFFTYRLDSLRGEIYADSTFFPAAGETYTLTITHPDFPTLTDTTKVPEEPRIDESSLVVMGPLVDFDLLPSRNTYLYDIYLLSPNDSLHNRIPNPDSAPIPITLPTSAEVGDPLAVHIYGYDANLAEYLTSMIPLKPQTYQETVTTVTGGYGAFGSVSATELSVTW